MRDCLRHWMLAAGIAGWLLTGPLPALGEDAAKKVTREEGKEEKHKVKKIIKVIHGDKGGQGFGWSGETRKRGFLGVSLVALTAELRMHFGTEKDAGVMVSLVEPGSPAAKAGVKVGDILTEVDAKKVDSIWKVVDIVGQKKEGEKVSLKLFREKKVLALTATVAEREKALVEISEVVKEMSCDECGGDMDVQVDSGAFDEAVERAQDEACRGIKLFKFNKAEGDLEKRLKEMEEKIKTLEKKLQGSLPPSQPGLAVRFAESD